MTTFIDTIDACLPQTQCTQCGYPRCRLYAEALARGEADINRCPPGNVTTLHALARVLGVGVKPLDPTYGRHRPRTRALIDEAVCIGCRKCIDACPVDAILGARKLMHTVLEQECSGCELCLAPCPVDCISLVPVAPAAGAAWPEYTHEETERWRQRTLTRLHRLQAGTRSPAPHTTETESLRRKAEIRAAVARVKEKRRLTTHK